MKSARERAIDAAYDFGGGGMSRSLFVMLLADKSKLGEVQRALVDAIERAIVADREAVEKSRAPS